MKVFNNLSLKQFLVYFLFFLNLFSGTCFGSNSLSRDSIKILPADSGMLEVRKPGVIQENIIFSDPKLQYGHDVKYEPGMFERFLRWLTELIFGDRNYDNIRITREIIIWTVVIISLAIMMWLFLRSDFSKLIKPESKLTTFNFSEITDDLSTINFDRMIEEAVKNEDYRTAVRWYYLKSLYLLEKGGHLVFQPSKTNIDYQNDLRRSEFLNEFMNASRIYDYVWYGKFNVNSTKYSDLKEEFIAFQHKLNVQWK